VALGLEARPPPHLSSVPVPELKSALAWKPEPEPEPELELEQPGRARVLGLASLLQLGSVRPLAEGRAEAPFGHPAAA
jgi:hypothetical protein